MVVTRYVGNIRIDNFTPLLLSISYVYLLHSLYKLPT